jgi:hypothetical protein
MRLGRRREKVFGPGRALPLDRNAKARIAVYARAWSARNRRPGQHKGPLTRAFLDVLGALLWGFHNARSGACFPSYEAIAARAGCARSTVAEALKALEFAGVLTWQNRVVRIRERCRDLFGHDGWRWRVIRSSNAYYFRDPKPELSGVPASKSENPTGTRNQDSSSSVPSRPCVRQRKEERCEGGAAAVAEIMRAASALPDLLQARRAVLAARWQRA